MRHAYYPALDGLRTIAVGIVLCAHGGVTWFRSGGVGVDIFFVLSGFLITTILSGEWDRTGAISFRNFYARRFLRLVPALVVTCALVAVAKPAFGEPFPGTDLALALTYTSNWALAFFNHHLTWLNHCWSLAIEEQFYLIWPLVIVGLERSVRAPAAKAGLMLAGAACIAAYRAWHVGVWPDERLNFGLDTRMDTLMAGAALAYYVKALRVGAALADAAGRAYTPRRFAPPLFIEGISECAATEVPSMKRGAQGAGCVEGVLPETAGRILGWLLAPCSLLTLLTIPRIVTWYSPWMGWIGYVIVAGLAAVVLADLVVGRHSLLAPVLATRPMVFVGRISYGVYLLHLPVYYAVDKLIPMAPVGVRFGCKVGLSLALATASYYLVEKRFLKMKERFSES